MSASRSARLTTTEILSLPYRCRMAVGNPAGAADGRQFLVRDHDDPRGRLERVEHGRVGPRNIEHDVAVVLLGELQQRADAAHVHRRQHDAIGRASRSTPDLVWTIRFRKNASSSRCVFSSASTMENRGSAPRNTAASPLATMQIDRTASSRAASFASAVATLTATVVAADAALGADEREHLACAAVVAGLSALKPVDGGTDVRHTHRLGDDLVHAGAHRFEQQRRIELRASR